MTEKYFLMIHWFHSMLQTRRNELVFDNTTTVENFRKEPINEKITIEIFQQGLKDYNYELSYNQTANGTDLFLKSLPKEILTKCGRLTFEAVEKGIKF